VVEKGAMAPIQIRVDLVAQAVAQAIHLVHRGQEHLDKDMLVALLRHQLLAEAAAQVRLVARERVALAALAALASHQLLRAHHYIMLAVAVAVARERVALAALAAGERAIAERPAAQEL
jgi:hypothetical protein